MERLVVGLINTDKGMNETCGSGFILGYGGLVATAYHVVNDWELRTLRGYCPPMQRHPMAFMIDIEERRYSIDRNFLFSDRKHDIAIVRAFMDDNDARQAAFMARTPDPGEGVTAYKSPHIDLGEHVKSQTIEDASYDTLLRTRHGTMLLTDMLKASGDPLRGGYSGGPVVHEEGVAGVIVGGYSEEDCKNRVLCAFAGIDPDRPPAVAARVKYLERLLKRALPYARRQMGSYAYERTIFKTAMQKWIERGLDD